ncbi:MAG: CbiX/SirB N-terminal domain-containing protein [Polyangiaceae bacterium]
MSLEATRVVILVGHGAPPADFPRDELTRLKALEGRRRASGAPMSEEERALDERVRTWPRTAASDPYQAGFQKVHAALARALAPVPVRVAYNEFCAPSLDDAVRAAVAEGARRVDVVPSMLTPGGVHSEVEIPETLEALRGELAGVAIHYAWPFSLEDVAALLARQLDLRCPAPPEPEPTP